MSIMIAMTFVNDTEMCSHFLNRLACPDSHRANEMTCT